jgi:hypothetical protein
MAFQATTGLGVAAKIVVEGNVSTKTVNGYNEIVLSLSGVNGPTTFQLNPQIQDVAGNEITAGTAFTLSAVAASTPGTLTLTSVAASANGTAVYTGTITGGGSNAYIGQSFLIAGFVNSVNNGLFIATASTATTLTLENLVAVAETHAATATPEEGTAVYTGTITGAGTALTLTGVAASSGGSAVYTGTITGGASNGLVNQIFAVTGFTNAANNGTFVATASTATTLTLNNVSAVAETHAGTATTTYAGLTFTVTGFTAANNNGTFIATASTSTTLTLENPAATAVTAAGTATTQEIEGGNDLTYVEYGFKTLTGNTYQPSGTPTQIVTVSPTGLVTAVAKGEGQVETSYPTFDNSIGDVVSPGNIMNGLPINKIYAENRVVVLI